MGHVWSKILCYYYTTTDTHTITVAHDVAETVVAGVTTSLAAYTAHRVGEIAVQLDLAALVTAGEGGTVQVRLYHKIDGTNFAQIDLAEFRVGADAVMPTVTGKVDKTATAVKLTIQCSSAVTGDTDVPFVIVEAG